MEQKYLQSFLIRNGAIFKKSYDSNSPKMFSELLRGASY